MRFDAQTIAESVLASLDAGGQREPFSTTYQGLTNGDAYAVTAAVRKMRLARGEASVGRKIGFTNRNIWPEYGVYEPIWGDMYDTTVHDVAAGDIAPIMRLPEPRIEPEIVLGLDGDLRPGMSLPQIEAAIGWIAHGFEFVQSIYPGWRFKTADCIIDGGLHGAMFVGAKMNIPRHERGSLAARLANIRVALSRNGDVQDRGVGANALDGPVNALMHLVEVLGRDSHNPPLKAGEMITTGTLTRAYAVAFGERWSTTIEGVDLPGLSMEIA